MTKNWIADWIKQTFTFRVITRVSLEAENEQQVARFESIIKGFHEIELARRIAGEATFILFIAVRDERSFEEFIKNRLNPIPGVNRIDSLFAQTGFKTFSAYEGGPENHIIKF